MNIVITGASRGIGKAIAEIFAKDGADLFLISKNEQVLAKTVSALSAEYPAVKIHSTAIDLSIKENAVLVGNIISEKKFNIDVLINNAGFFIPGNVMDEEDGQIEKMLSVNLLSAYHVTRSLLPQMIQQKRGHIFNVCSVASLKAYPNGGSYSISKFALMGFSKNLREELMPYNIKVTAVYPGATLTDSWGDYDNSSQRILEASDIAQMVLAATKLSPQAVVEDIVIRPILGDL